ncbi:hypothetical protein TEA_021217 [Camellia sinensis var. sinensis]|uniref:THIF-type NAD/FAD binding fold domain-containing protein n=1 Tax=Camellia sinensis var. sinensis TaxID=542762 RepID=A0A4V3WQW3_CAMSN|nr:hypothetical protein TEA_021217 [Camellia sinensis var. sinensis]
MEERMKCLALVGAGALLGSVTTIALFRLITRSVASQPSRNVIDSEVEALSLSRSPLKSIEALSLSCSPPTSIEALRRRSKTSDPVVSVSISVDPVVFEGKGFIPDRAVKGHDVCGNQNHERPNVDLLKDEIVSEQLTRNIQFFGIESQQKVSASYVVVIGLGGVGSHAASMLLRSGVGRLLLVDFDQVSLSSLNRHAVAIREDVGIPKAHCLKKHFSSIFPECHVDAKVLLYDTSSEEEILSGHPDFVLDCIDNIDTKVALLAACVRRGLRVLSATGAGARADPTRIRVADLRESTNDPLSRAVRHRLRKDHGIEGGIPSIVVYNYKLIITSSRFVATAFKSITTVIVPGFRVRIIPVLGTIPAIFGQVMASYIVTQLAGLGVQTEPVVNFGMDHYHVLHQRLIEHEELLYGTSMQVQYIVFLEILYVLLSDVEEVMYIVKELWHGGSAKEQSTKAVGRGMWRSINDLMLVRWDSAKPASISNLILLRFKEANEHELRTLEDIKDKEPEFFSRVTSVLKRAEVDFGLKVSIADNDVTTVGCRDDENRDGGFNDETMRTGMEMKVFQKPCRIFCNLLLCFCAVTF